MKCPKCGYLGFETVDRCRNCGYDFSLTQTAPPSPELPLNEGGPGSALADLDLSPKSNAARPSADLDLDRLLGVETEPADHDDARGQRLETPVPAPSAPLAAAEASLPLFTDPSTTLDEGPMVAPPRPVGPPLAVRRPSLEVPKGRSRGARPQRRDDRPLTFEPETGDTRTEVSGDARMTLGAAPALAAASRTSRVLAALLDVVILGGINVAILYLTLQLAGITVADLHMLPVVPMATFLLLLDGGYLAALTAAGGKTIGKMATGIRVIGDDGRAVDASGAVLRAVGCLVTVLALGLPYLPALLAPDGRALADRLAGTRVIRDE